MFQQCAPTEDEITVEVVKLDVTADSDNVTEVEPNGTDSELDGNGIGRSVEIGLLADVDATPLKSCCTALKSTLRF